MMKVIGYGLALAILLVGCGSASESGETRKDIAKEMLATLNEIANVLDSVTDEASAKAAPAKLTALNKKMDAIKARGDELPALSADEKKALSDEFAPQMEAIAGRMMKNTMRINFSSKLRAHSESISAALSTTTTAAP